MSVQLTLTLPDGLVEQIAKRVAELMRQESGDAEAESPWLTFDQACGYTGLSPDALYKLTAARAIPMRKKLHGQGLRFLRAELDAWMETQYPRVDRLA